MTFLNFGLDLNFTMFILAYYYLNLWAMETQDPKLTKLNQIYKVVTHIDQKLTKKDD